MIATIIICVFEALHIILIIESFYLVSLTKVNSGVPNTLHCVKVIWMCVVFYFFFKQKINYYDITGIVFCVLWVILIALSGSGFVVDGSSMNFLFSCLMILLGISLQIPKIIITKFYFWYGENDVNAIHFKVFHDLILFSFVVQIIISV